jgi:hypothetical protein
MWEEYPLTSLDAAAFGELLDFLAVGAAMFVDTQAV